ncbi:DUF456 domain-containing protein [Natrinema thermotolerans]|uniref:DUF456 domain-containing protein n=1 Tax=Natrinema thermotolerans TaxID=121872 RepID=A0AAF0PBG9_9EURY|nr:DUF456 domain-containing protein [Natrinema thermotolerans]QCC60419.1 DUF456 domain-containing protein [Natrinema thermotolerans]QCC61324.1 DUF456 domain-containing protein [Natrinema thermotolerans]WMT07448.1 DUF456 domain-containing protein [Natrinema thermotolerans]WMT08080.1 DUF456 domain-containing protein [Natrinema thermotolerans]
MVDVVLVVAVALLAGAIVGAAVPMVPSGLLSLAGLGVYWWGSGTAEISVLTFAVLAVIAVITALIEFFGGSIAARAGGASWLTTAVAAGVGIALMLVTGPVGLLAGLFGTVFVLEFVRGEELEGSARSAVYTTVGTLASTAVQVLLTATILLGFLVAVFLL